MREKAGELAFDGFRLDPANALLWRGDDRVPLPPKPFEVLCCLAARAGQLVTKEELLDAVWSNLDVSESSSSVSVNALRIALGDDAKAPRYIETIARRGYCFIAPVRPVGRADSPQPLSLTGQAPPVNDASSPRWWVGRQGPLEVLETGLQEAMTGNRQMVFVTGEAGIGKTTLIDMFVERISRHGIELLLGRCIEHFGTDEAFLPFTEALQDYCASADGSFLLKTLRKIAPTWLVQMQRFLDAQDRAALQRELLGATRERMLREFCEFLEVVSADRPWVIIVEDLHWSDYATLDVLSRFARRDQKAPVLVLATYRPSDALTGGHPARTVLQELHIHGRCRELALGTLSLPEVEQYLTLRFDETTMAQTLARRVFQRTGGHPLFVVSLVDYFVSQRGVLNLNGHWTLAPDEHVFREGMPRDLREMIVHEVHRLSDGEQRLLEAASAAGSEFSAAMVAGALERGIQEVEQICEELVRRGQILVSAGISEWPDGTLAGRYGFKHALYQEFSTSSSHQHNAFGCTGSSESASKKAMDNAHRKSQPCLLFITKKKAANLQRPCASLARLQKIRRSVSVTAKRRFILPAPWTLSAACRLGPIERPNQAPAATRPGTAVLRGSPGRARRSAGRCFLFGRSSAASH